jgi:glycolate oxidase FAD binding subunit|tara:strand:+ start:7680 stop:8708 length:1029 start_codon:yes stop_codon:yes gene_type:complete
MDATATLQRLVRQALTLDQPILPEGGGTKRFLRPITAGVQVVSTAEHQGILHYHPDELVIRVRAGTRLSDLHETLREAGQCLPCDPPSFGAASTVGGMVASGLAGPSRPYVGGVRDYVLGMTVILPSGDVATFGGDVMKNVAGYDISRLNVGAMGSLGLILDVALKVLPNPERVQAYRLACAAPVAQQQMLLQRRLPGLSACAYFNAGLLVRYQGSEQARPAFEKALAPGFEPVSGEDLDRVRDLAFDHKGHLWRWDGPVDAAVNDDLVAMDWGGALRWLAADQPIKAADDPGAITWFRQGEAPAPELGIRGDAVGRLQQRLKQTLDPKGTFIDYPALRPVL